MLSTTERIDPPSCRCTDCLTGYSEPYDGGKDQVLALLRGTVADATYGDWKNSGDVATALHTEWLAGRVVFRDDVANDIEAIIGDVASYDTHGQLRPLALAVLLRTLRTAVPKTQP